MNEVGETHNGSSSRIDIDTPDECTNLNFWFYLAVTVKNTEDIALIVHQDPTSELPKEKQAKQTL